MLLLLLLLYIRSVHSTVRMTLHSVHTTHSFITHSRHSFIHPFTTLIHDMLTPIMARPFLHRLITYALLIYSFASPVKSFPSPNSNNSPGSYSSPSFNQTSASEMAYPQPAYRSVAYFVVSLLTFVLIIRWERVRCSNSMYSSIHKIEKRIDTAAAAFDAAGAWQRYSI